MPKVVTAIIEQAVQFSSNAAADATNLSPFDANNNASINRLCE